MCLIMERGCHSFFLKDESQIYQLLLTSSKNMNPSQCYCRVNVSACVKFYCRCNFDQRLSHKLIVRTSKFIFQNFLQAILQKLPGKFFMVRMHCSIFRFLSCTVLFHTIVHKRVTQQHFLVFVCKLPNSMIYYQKQNYIEFSIFKSSKIRRQGPKFSERPDLVGKKQN